MKRTVYREQSKYQNQQSVCESQSGAETSPNFLKKLEPDLIKLEPDLINLENP